MRTRLFHAALLVACASLSACATKGAVLGRLQNDLTALPPAPLCGTVTRVGIADERAGVSERPLRIPTMSSGQQDEARPELTDALRTAIREEVTRRIRTGSGEYEVAVTILEGVQRFSSTWRSEEESVRWVVEATIVGREGRASAQQEVEYAVRSLDASRGYTERLYKAALRYGVAGAVDRAAQRLPEGARGCPAEPAAAPAG